MHECLAPSSRRCQPTVAEVVEPAAERDVIVKTTMVDVEEFVEVANSVARVMTVIGKCYAFRTNARGPASLMGPRGFTAHGETPKKLLKTTFSHCTIKIKM